MTKNKDCRHQNFENVGPVRLTYVKGENRPKGRNWAGKDVIRIQAYVDLTVSEALHRGAEIPVDGPAGALDLIASLSKLCRREPTRGS
jgi:hypothetical protein